MTHEATTRAYVGAFVDELVRAGVRHVCVSPGSRSTPLAMLFAEHPGARLWMHRDERSSAFFGLGIAKASREPAALVCTSGSAAANFFPAVVEARYARVPLVVLTADRPPELRENGAPQTIDQVRLYGDHAKWFFDLPLPEGSAEALRFARTLAGRAVATARAGPAGPVHLNLPFREPLVPIVGPTAADDDAVAAGGRPDGAAYVAVHDGRGAPDPALVDRLADELAGVERGLIVCGPQDDPELAPSLAALAGALGYPVLADPLSGVRCGAHDRGLVLDAYDAFLRDPALAGEAAPEVVLRFGAMPTSKPVLLYLQRHPGARQVVVDGDGGWQEPTSLAATHVWADGARLCRALTGRIVRARGTGRILRFAQDDVGSAQDDTASASDDRGGGAGGRPSGWLRRWLEADRAARAAIRNELAGIDEPFEGRVLAELAELLPEGTTLFAGNSMPVRDLDTFFPSSDRAIRMLANRGTNGIDGVVSSALGASVVSSRPLVLVIGDLSLYHDMNGLLAAKLYQLDATIVLLNNDGGGIFSFLPQAAHAEHFELLFGTPHGLDFRPAVEMYGGQFERVTEWPAFRDAVGRALRAPGLKVIEVPTERRRNVELHRRVWPAVSAALRRLDASSGAAGSLRRPAPRGAAEGSRRIFSGRTGGEDPSPSLRRRCAPQDDSRGALRRRQGGARDDQGDAQDDEGGPPRAVSSLNVEVWGDGPPLLLLHGFTGSTATWAPFRETLGAGWRLIAVDLLGHGASPSPADSAIYAVEREAERLAVLLDRLEAEPASVLGYSMGGRVALQLALTHPGRVGRLVLESASPGIVDPAERAARVRSDGALAELLEREGIEPFVERWERVPLFASQGRLPAERRANVRADRLRRDPVGLANSLRGAGQGVARPVLDRLGALAMPTLLLVGALDERYVGFGRLMAERIHSAELVVVPDAGHAVHLEQPRAFEAAVADFLRRE